MGKLLVIEGLLVAGEPLLEGVGSEPDVLLGGACSFNSALVNKAVGLTLPFQGAVSLVLGPAVAALNLQASRGSKYLLIVARNEASHIRHTTVADFYSIPVEVPVELRTLWKVPVQHSQELLCYVGANLVVPWRVEPGHISLPDPLLSCRLLSKEF